MLGDRCQVDLSQVAHILSVSYQSAEIMQTVGSPQDALVAQGQDGGDWTWVTISKP